MNINRVIQIGWYLRRVVQSKNTLLLLDFEAEIEKQMEHVM
jgi:hypothetical protein